jgi:hypothetical protein
MMLSQPIDPTQSISLYAEIKQPSENGPVVNPQILLSLVMLKIVYVPGLGFIYFRRQQTESRIMLSILNIFIFTFRLPPVRTTLTNRRVYLWRLRARPLGVLAFS